MFYNFKCNSCLNEWESNIGQYPLRFITDAPCSKCNKVGDIVAEKLLSVLQNTSSNTSANIVSGVGGIDKKLDGDFRDFMQAIKDGSKGCNMRDYK